MDLWAKKVFFPAVDFKCLTPEPFFCMQISNWVQLWKESKHDDNVKSTDIWQSCLFFELFFFISSIYQNSCETEYIIWQPATSVVGLSSCEYGTQYISGVVQKKIPW